MGSKPFPSAISFFIYIGLPLTRRYSEVGDKVMGFDMDENNAKTLKYTKTELFQEQNKSQEHR